MSVWSARTNPELSRRSFLGAAAAGGAALAFGRLPAIAAADRGPRMRALAQDVRAEFLRTYEAYQRLAFPHDQLLPVSGTGADFFVDGHPVLLSVVESLGTLYLMGLDDELEQAVEQIGEHVDFDVDAEVQVFEVIIRMVGGLLSGYLATGERVLLDKCADLGNRLLPAFQKSPTGMPYRFVNLRTGEVSGDENVLAEIGTNIPELGTLGRLTNDPRFYQASKAAQKAVFDRRSALDLVGTSLNVETGAWVDRDSTVNPPVDSFYEYLFDGFDLFGDRDLLAWFRTLTDSIVARQSIEIDGNLWFSTVDFETGEETSRRQSELAAFYAGLLGQGGYLDLGRRYEASWGAALQRFAILPEEIEPATFEATQKGNQLRPEYVDSALNLWLLTHDDAFVDLAADYYQRMKATSRVANGYTILDDVTTDPPTQGDLTSGYWYAENMKYYWLMFSGTDRFDYRHNYLTTEGNVLRGFRRPRRGRR
jgi:mannosyl-oligosaccharide alpha-1,2-mannosidase